MVGYPVETKEEDVKAAGINLRISRRKANKICREINMKNMKFERAKKFVEDLVDGEESIDGKTYRSAAEGVLEVLKSAEANAEFKGIPTDKLKVQTITAEPGSGWRRRRRRSDFGTKLKTANVKVVLRRG